MKKVGFALLSVLLVYAFASVVYANADEHAANPAAVNDPNAKTISKVTDKATLKAMSILISNFSEQGIYDYNDGNSENKISSMDDALRFGMKHVYINYYKNRIIPCKNCQYGDLSVKQEHVFDAVKKYLDMDFAPLFKEGKVRYKYDEEDGFYHDQQAGMYHFDRELAGYETVYYARVTEANMIEMAVGGAYYEAKGYFYLAKDDDERNGTFTATIKRGGEYIGKNSLYLTKVKWTEDIE